MAAIVMGLLTAVTALVAIGWFVWTRRHMWMGDSQLLCDGKPVDKSVV